MRIRTLAPQAAILAAAALTLTACSSSSGTGAAGAASSSSNGSSASSSSNGSATSSSAGDFSPSGSSAPSGAGAACAGSQLKVAQADSDVGAGQYYSRLVFTNISGRTCTLSGYPGVSYVQSGGVQSGNPAERSTGRPVTTVTLHPGGTAGAVLHDSNGISGYSPQQCRLTPAEGLRVYPPNQKDALFVPWKTSHCAGKDVHSFTIGPVEK